MINLLNKTIFELKTSIKDVSAADAINISAILKSIKNKKPHVILKEIESLGYLHNFIENKKTCEQKSIDNIKKFISVDLENKQAIDIIIHLHFLMLIASGKQDPIKWPAEITKRDVIAVKLADKSYKKAEVQWILEQIEDLTDEKLTLKVSEIAEKIRILPKDTPFPGPWSNKKTPYLVEFMDDASESSPIEVSVFMKSHQIGATTAAENIITYIIKYAPGPILYATATDHLAKEWSETRFDQMLEQSGMNNMIFSQTTRRGSKKTGDKTNLKEFPGGRIKIVGYGSTAAFRQSSYQIFIGDETDEASLDLKRQGNTLEQAEGRTSAYKAKRKIILLSTPVEIDLSNIYQAYLLGDQRKYFVPCPYCGFMQELEFKHLKYKRDKDGLLDVESVKYECQGTECDEHFYNYHKAEMYSSGRCEWRPTAKAKRLNYRSRHMSCLYSPPGMITWADIVQKNIDAIESNDPGKLKTFETLYLGWPYREKGEKPEFQKVIAHRSNYQSKTVPKDVLFLTLGGDVHGDNITLEALGHGRDYKTWSIDYVVIKGDTKAVTKGAWPKFRQMFLDGAFVYENEKGKYAPQMAFIDSNYRTATVEEFCETVTGLFPIIGKDKFAHKQQKFRINQLPGTNLMSVMISTNYHKDIVYNSLRIESLPGQETPMGYPAFPYNYDDKYFKELNAEYKRSKIIGNRREWEYYCPQGKPNHALDCRVYNIAAREVLFYQVLEMMEEAIEQYEQQVHRKILNSEKVAYFYDHMENVGVFKT